MGLIEMGLLRRIKGWIFSESPNPYNAGLFDHLEGWWGRFTVWAKLCLFVGLFVVLIVIWVCVKPELAQFISYLLGGLLLFRQIAISGKRATTAKETAKAMQKTVQSTEKGNIDERFKNAIEHLGDESASTRLGGIFALHHIAQEVEEYRERVFEILCAHIRETTTHETYELRKIESEQEKPAIEIQSILDLLLMRTPGCEIYKGLKTNLENANLVRSKLIKANLKEANLQGASLHGADLHEADLHEANLKGTNLKGADLPEANLKEANLPGANLQGANLQGANLQGANLQEAKLQGANLSSAKLQKTDLSKAYLVNTNLQSAHLQEANLQKANLRMANLQTAYLDKADFRDADLIGAKNLKTKKLLYAKTLYKAKLPDRIEEDIKQQKPELLKNPSSKKEA